MMPRTAAADGMDLRELRYFRAIAEFGTFSKASAHLRVAQPALSRQMQKLEHSLGVALLRRTSRGVTPTPAGEALLRRTRRLEHELEVARREVTGFADSVTGVLRVAVQYPLSVLMVPRLMRRFQLAYPGVTLHFIDGVSGSIGQGLLSEEIDVAIVEVPSHDHVDLTARPLWIETVHLVGPASAVMGTGCGTASRIAWDAPVALAEVEALPLIMPSQKHAQRRLVEAAFARSHLRLRPIIEADGAMMILEMVKHGLGYTLMPPCVFQPLVAAGELVSTPTRPSIRRTVALVTRTTLLDERAVGAFVAMVDEAVPDLVHSARFGPAVLYRPAPDLVAAEAPARVAEPAG